MSGPDLRGHVTSQSISTGKKRYLLPQSGARRWWRPLVAVVCLLVCAILGGLFGARWAFAHPCWMAAGGSFAVPVGLLDGNRMMRTQWCDENGEPSGPAISWLEVAP